MGAEKIRSFFVAAKNLCFAGKRAETGIKFNDVKLLGEVKWALIKGERRLCGRKGHGGTGAAQMAQNLQKIRTNPRNMQKIPTYTAKSFAGANLTIQMPAATLTNVQYGGLI